MKALVTGGDGFIGRHLVRQLQNDGVDVDVYDIKQGNDARNTDDLIKHLDDVDVIYHLAAHADIALSAINPMLDFDEGTRITTSVLEAARIAGVKRILFSSSSAIYGDCGDTVTDENYGPLIPISTYAASKLACEAMLASYCHIFGMTGLAFRFANVVGPGQPRGVAYDFIRKLKKDPTHLEILGNGTQIKSYVHVSDVVSAILRAGTMDWSSYNVYNIATDDTLTATEIAQLACEVNGIGNECVFTYTGGNNGWPGDVPIVRVSTNRLRSLGWTHTMSSRDAILDSLRSMQ